MSYEERKAKRESQKIDFSDSKIWQRIGRVVGFLLVIAIARVLIHA